MRAERFARSLPRLLGIILTCLAFAFSNAHAAVNAFEAVDANGVVLGRFMNGGMGGLIEINVDGVPALVSAGEDMMMGGNTGGLRLHAEYGPSFSGADCTGKAYVSVGYAGLRMATLARLADGRLLYYGSVAKSGVVVAKTINVASHIEQGVCVNQMSTTGGVVANPAIDITGKWAEPLHLR